MLPTDRKIVDIIENKKDISQGTNDFILLEHMFSTEGTNIGIMWNKKFTAWNKKFDHLEQIFFTDGIAICTRRVNQILHKKK